MTSQTPSGKPSPDRPRPAQAPSQPPIRPSREPWYRDASRFLHRIANARSSLAALYAFAVVEGIMLPIPIEAVIMPFMQLRRDLLWRIAAVALAGYYTAAITGYAIGALFFDQIGAPLIASMGWQQSFADLEAFFAEHGFISIVALGLTPLPAQLLMIGAGAFGVPLLSFTAAILLGRGARTFGAGALIYFFGDRVAHYFHRRRTRKNR